MSENKALSHILEPIANHDPELLRRVAESLNNIEYDFLLGMQPNDEKHVESEIDVSKAVGEMLHRAIMYLEGLKADKG